MEWNRERCAAVIVENDIVVLGGWGEQGVLKSVKFFNCERYNWEERPQMSHARCFDWLHTAAVV